MCCCTVMIGRSMIPNIPEGCCLNHRRLPRYSLWPLMVTIFWPMSAIRTLCRYLVLLALADGASQALAAEQVLTAKLYHLRSGAVREWADFPEQAEARELRLTFS